MIDRQELAKALAKAIAHKQAGNEALANDWAAYLVVQLGAAGVLVDTHRKMPRPAR